jgi:hypothetical protein
MQLFRAAYCGFLTRRRRSRLSLSWRDQDAFDIGDRGRIGRKGLGPPIGNDVHHEPAALMPRFPHLHQVTYERICVQAPAIISKTPLTISVACARDTSLPE